MTRFEAGRRKGKRRRWNSEHRISRMRARGNLNVISARKLPFEWTVITFISAIEAVFMRHHYEARCRDATPGAPSLHLLPATCLHNMQPRFCTSERTLERSVRWDEDKDKAKFIRGSSHFLSRDSLAASFLRASLLCCITAATYAKISPANTFPWEKIAGRCYRKLRWCGLGNLTWIWGCF